MGVGVDMGVDVDGGLFLSLNLLIIIWYIVYVYRSIRGKYPSPFEKFSEVGGRDFLFQNHSR